MEVFITKDSGRSDYSSSDVWWKKKPGKFGWDK